MREGTGGGPGSSNTELFYSKHLGRAVRGGSAEQLSVPTDTLIARALKLGNRELAEEYFEYGAAEVARNIEIFNSWLAEMLRLGEAEVSRFDRGLSDLTRTLGAPPPLVDADAVASAELASARAAIAAADATQLRLALRTLREAQRAVHDLQADWCWGLLTLLRDALGEGRIEEVFRVTEEPWVAKRYQHLEEMTPEEILALTVEGMRGHLSGPDRNGSVDVREENDRWVLSFDPCGSGGRMRRGDSTRAQAPRTDPPYGFGVTLEAHAWSWGRTGVCLYCAQCAFVNEILPIERRGAPMRVVDHPDSPNAPCRWTIYKSPDFVPDEAFARVGKLRRPRHGFNPPAGSIADRD